MSKQAANLMNAISISYSCSRDICQEILVGDSPQDYTVVGEHSASGLPPGRVELGVMIQTDDLKPSGEKIDPVHVSYLSAGTELTFWWVRLIALVLLKHNEYQFGWEKQPATLLIDEIENHLHPTWQRRVIPALLKHFPGLQIFATTHSPFVVAGIESRAGASAEPGRQRRHHRQLQHRGHYRMDGGRNSARLYGSRGSYG